MGCTYKMISASSLSEFDTKCNEAENQGFEPTSSPLLSDGKKLDPSNTVDTGTPVICQQWVLEEEDTTGSPRFRSRVID